MFSFSSPGTQLFRETCLGWLDAQHDGIQVLVSPTPAYVKFLSLRCWSQRALLDEDVGFELDDMGLSLTETSTLRVLVGSLLIFCVVEELS